MSEALILNEHEGRVLGVLIEKSFTTPDQYPLSMNAITAGANQKSNRNPKVDYLEPEVFIAVTGLCHKLLAGKVSQSGSRVERYRHNAGEILRLDPAGLAVMAELLLRGPQTAGELRQRATRMQSLGDQAALAGLLQLLYQRGLAKEVPMSGGSRVQRTLQTLVPAAEAPAVVDAPAESQPSEEALVDAESAAGTEQSVGGQQVAGLQTSGQPNAANQDGVQPSTSMEYRMRTLEQDVADIKRLLADLLD